jgi:uncharacterized protein YbjT (DUF2867 family)
VTGRIWILGGEPGVADAVERSAASAGLAVCREGQPGEPAPIAGDAVIDLGLVPARAIAEVSLAEQERRRAEEWAARLPADMRVVRASAFGARPDAPTRLQRAHGAAEDVYRSAEVELVALRVGLLLGPVGLAACLRRAVERSVVIPLPGLSRAKFEPVALEDFALYCVRAATATEALDDAYDLSCGEVVTGELLVRLLVDTLGHRRWILSLPGFARPSVARLFGRPSYPARFVLRDLEVMGRGLLPLRLNAWKHLAVEPRSLREGLALAAGMAAPLRKKGEGRYGAWHAPEKKGILWRRKR